jgi:hypothetical protein
LKIDEYFFFCVNIVYTLGVSLGGVYIFFSFGCSKVKYLNPLDKFAFEIFYSFDNVLSVDFLNGYKWG